MLLEMNEHWSGHSRILEALQKERAEATMTLVVPIAMDPEGGMARINIPAETWVRKSREL